MSELGRPFLPPDLRELIERDRNSADPPADIRQEVARRLDRNLGLGGALLVPGMGSALESSPSQPPPIPPPASLLGWKMFAGAAVATFVAGGLLLSSSQRSRSVPQQGERAVAAARAPQVDPTVVFEPGLESSGGSTPSANAGARSDQHLSPGAAASAHAAIDGAKIGKRRVAARAPRPATDTLAAERTVLDAARTALVHHDAETALASVHSHEQAFPRGQLLEERESMRVQALTMAHDFAGARVAAGRFQRRFPRSMFLSAVERALDSSP